MKKQIVIERFLTPSNVRELCIDRGYYTCGDCDEYNHLLCDLVNRPGAFTDEDFQEIALDIFYHSNVSGMCESYGVDRETLFCYILEELYNAANTVVNLSK